MSPTDRILAAVDAATDEIVDFTRELIRLPTVNPPGEGYAECAELIGTNHPMWLAFARHFGLAMSMLTGEDQYDAAGLEMRKPDDLVEVVGRQAPGTWLPLSIRRDGQESELIAKFPPRPRQE